MPYFNMSTANPTGVRPWGFAMQAQKNQLGRLRGLSRLKFYLPSDYPLPQSTLGNFFPRIANIRQSPYTGKNTFGDPQPIYKPLNPFYYRPGLGFVPPTGARSVQPFNSAGPVWGPLVNVGGDPILPGPAQDGNPLNLPPVPVTGSGVPISQIVWANGGQPITYNPGQPVNWNVYYQQQIAAQQAAAAAAQQAAANAAAASAAAIPASQVAASPSSQAAAVTAPAATAPSWFTDPTQDVITGLPNWGLVAIAAGGALLLSGKGRR
jgi:hypothetical protein